MKSTDEIIFALAIALRRYAILLYNLLNNGVKPKAGNVIFVLVSEPL